MTATLKSCLKPTSNSLNAIRLALATTVIVSHSWPLGGHGVEPKFGGETPGSWAVFAFFAISGYLIMGSRVNNGLTEYLRRRALRIFPAFLVCLVVTAFVFAPVGYWRVHHTLHGFLSANPTPINYIYSNMTLKMNVYAISGTPVNLPFKGAWDGALWSLYYEFVCYLIIGFAACWTVFRRTAAPVVALFALSTLDQLFSDRVMHFAQNPDLFWITKLLPFFAAGSLLFMLRDRVLLHPALAGLSAVIMLVLGLYGPHRTIVLIALPLAYLILWLGATLPLHRVGSRNDVSYGMYIYGFPVQQLLAQYGVHKLTHLVYIALSVLLTVPGGRLLVHRRKASYESASPGRTYHDLERTSRRCP